MRIVAMEKQATRSGRISKRTQYSDVVVAGTVDWRAAFDESGLELLCSDEERDSNEQRAMVEFLAGSSDEERTGGNEDESGSSKGTRKTSKSKKKPPAKK
jgi:hypothetical protein